MIAERIKKLRDKMKQENIAAYIIPSIDAHQGEYVPSLWQRRAWICGFKGSAGDVVITSEKGGLWTDGRYYVQAEEQLSGSGIELYKASEKETIDIPGFLVENLNDGDFIGVDPKIFSGKQMISLIEDLKQSGLKIKHIEQNLIDAIWDDQPELPTTPIHVHTIKFAGESVDDKLSHLRFSMEKNNCDIHVITMLDAIAWLFNLRGKDADFNPVFIAYAIVSKNSAQLFTKEEKITDEVRQHLGKSVEVHDYSLFKQRLEEWNKESVKAWIDSSSTNHWIISLLVKCQVFDSVSPVILFKAIKNEAELKGFFDCHVRDGVAMVNYLCWLDGAVSKGGVTEKISAEKLESFRQEQDMYQGTSFSTISSYKIHGAIIHYSVTEESDIALQPKGVYLIDSGGQYLDGTTDITRTVTLGLPAKSEKEHFTRVLMGHINLLLTSFPNGTTGSALDTITRLPLWQAGLNFNHGTGHGVGSYLGVHEGPQSINPGKAHTVPLEIGMICSIEPGFYKDKEYGIRIENLVTVVHDFEKSTDQLEFLKFENGTFCPIDTRLVEKSIMSETQVTWLNLYHQMVWEKLSPHVEWKVKNWLKQATLEI